MRYPPEHKERTRVRILDAAAKVFRARGFAAGSVDDVMAEAGLTAGGFYAHFESKEALLAEVFKHGTIPSSQQLERGLEDSSHRAWIEAVMARYLSPAHRRQVVKGCPLPPLLAEVARGSEPAKQALETFVRFEVERFEAHLPGDHSQRPRAQALAMLALFVGGISLARAVADPSLSDEILAACRQFAQNKLFSSDGLPLSE